MPRHWRHSGSDWMGLWAPSSAWSCRCPCSLQGSWARWTLRIPFYSDHSMFLCARIGEDLSGTGAGGGDQTAWVSKIAAGGVFWNWQEGFGLENVLFLPLVFSSSSSVPQLALALSKCHFVLPIRSHWWLEVSNCSSCLGARWRGKLLCFKQSSHQQGFLTAWPCSPGRVPASLINDCRAGTSWLSRLLPGWQPCPWRSSWN